MKETLECYKILGIEPGCSAKLVRSAYLELAKTWDPKQHIENPALREAVEKKRKEIDEAYEAIRFFLPELQGPQNDVEKPRFSRDFKEMTTAPPVEMTRTVMGVLVAIIFILIFAFAAYLLMKGHRVAPSSAVPIE